MIIVHIQENIKTTFLVVLYRGKDAVYRFIKSIISEYNYCRKMTKKYINKNLIMSAAENE